MSVLPRLAATLALVSLARLATAAGTEAPAPATAPRIDRPPAYLDDLLGRPYDAETPFRATGRAVWCTHPDGFGFANDVHWVELDWLPAFALAVEWNGAPVPSGPAVAFPTHLETRGDGPPDLALVERKTVLEDDTLVSAIEAWNLGNADAALRIRASSPILAPVPTEPALGGSRVLHGVPIAMRLEVAGGTAAPGGALERAVVLPPGGRATLVTAMSLARSDRGARAAVAAALGAADPVGMRVDELRRRFLDGVPQLDVPDPWVEKLWAFRFDLLRRDATDPDAGPLRHPTLQEGRWSAPWYARTITYGAPHQLREARWLRDPALARGHALTFVDNARADGAFQSVPLQGPAPVYTDWIADGIAEVYAATGDTDLLSRSLAALRANVAYALSRDGDGDALPENDDHFATGMEWQPAWFYFDGFRTGGPPVRFERVDDAAALYANARATALAATAACDPVAAADAASTAARVRAAVEAKMWDAAQGTYLSLRAADDAKAQVREIVGFYPAAFDLAPPAHDGALAALFDPADFATPWPPASSSLLCPATDQDRWPIGPGGSPSMWNGPTWPHALSVVFDALGRAARRGSPPAVTRDQVFDLFLRYTEMQLRSTRPVTDPSQPWVGESIHGTLGVWKSGERDYLHSTYVDLVVTLLAGLQPSPDDVVRLDPLLPPGRWDRLLLDRLPYHGHALTIVWDEPGGGDAYGDGREGLDLWIDGGLAASRPDLGPLEAPLPRATLLAVKDAATLRPRFVSDAPPPWSLFRAAAHDLAGAWPVAGSPFAAAQGLDGSPPLRHPVAYYRQGGCGSGR